MTQPTFVSFINGSVDIDQGILQKMQRQNLGPMTQEGGRKRVLTPAQISLAKSIKADPNN